jgi:hypothetical protein
LSQNFTNQSSILMNLEVEPGLYFLEILSKDLREVKQIIKK